MHYTFGQYELDTGSRTLQHAGERVEIQSKAFDVLAYLIERRERFVSPDELLDAFWPDIHVTPAAVSAAVRKARRAVGDDGGQQALLRTKHGQGFRFVAEVCVAAAPGSLAEPIRSLAVLPLKNFSGDRDQEYFTDAMTEVLIGELAKISSLRVISRTSVMQYKNARKSLPEIGRELKVEGVIEGSVFRGKDRVRITVQLVDARTDRHVWAESFERDLRDVLALQRKVAREVTEQIELELTPLEEKLLAEAQAVDLEAIEAFTRASYQAALCTPKDDKVAIQFFEQAIERDPGFAPAYAEMTIVYVDVLEMGTIPCGEVAAKIREAASKAVALDPILGQAHTAQGYALLLDWKWREAGRAFERAVEVAPSNPWVYDGLSWFRLMERRRDEAIALMDHAVALNPYDHCLRAWYADRLVHAHRYEAGIKEARAILQTGTQACFAYLALFRAFFRLGKKEEAARALISRLQSYGDPRSEAAERNYDAAGFDGVMRGILAGDLERAEKGAVTSVFVANTHAMLGELELAFECLERAYHERAADMYLLGYAPGLDPLRSDPRFDDLLRRMNYPGVGAIEY